MQGIARALNPYKFPEQDWKPMVEKDEALQPKPATVQISRDL
jgi:hypothetical protein